MTTLLPKDPPPAPTLASQPMGMVDRLVEAVGDRLNPILVKETRQALKSRQFTLWFVLLLAACWVTTLGGVALVGPSIYYVSAGKTLLYAYYFVLALPLVVVVPFSAFRSLASEQEENTRDLLEVSTLTPRQVINGKLGSAAVQTLVYLSALAPCIAFTYLLRGVDVATIALLLAYAVLASVGLSAVGLLLAATARHRQSQVVLSVLFAGGLFSSFSAVMTGGMGVMQVDAADRARPEFFYAHAALLTAYLTTLGVVYCGASALCTFASANRSTPLRVALVVQQTALVAWVIGVWWAAKGDAPSDFLIVAVAAAAVYWAVAGGVMTGERAEMSHRVRRGLPSSLVGRLFLTWFNPGPASGYVFAVANLALVAGVAVALLNVLPPTAGTGADTAVTIILLMVAYVAAYLGLGRLAIVALRRLAPLSLFGCFLVQVLLTLGGASLPYLFDTLNLRGVVSKSLLLQAPSPVWSLSRLLNGTADTATENALIALVGGAASVMFLINLALAGREARQLREARPQRIVEDDLDHAPVLVTNPWGDTEVVAPREA